MEKIEISDPKSEAAVSLINELSDTLSEITGDDGRSSFSEEAFDSNTDVFLTLWLNDEAVACGSFRKLDEETCEIKRMYSKQKGCGKKILIHLENNAAKLNYSYVVLSTRKVNTQAVNFYRKHGYEEVEPYGKYKSTNLSVCMGKKINA